MLRIFLISAFIFVSFKALQASETSKGMKKDYESFKAEMNTKLDSVATKIEELRKKAKNKSSETEDQAIANLEKTREKLKAELDSAKENGKDSWSKFKDSFSKSVDNLNTKIQKSVKD